MVEHPAVYTLLSIILLHRHPLFVKEVPRTLCAQSTMAQNCKRGDEAREKRPAFTSGSRIPLAEASRDAWDTRVSFV